MTPPTLTIDLGELPRDEDPEPGPAWPFWRRLHRGNHGPGRLVAAAVVAGLALVTLTAATGGGPPVALGFTVEADNYTVDQRHLYALTTGAGETGQRLVAYRLADGGTAWERSLEDGGDGEVVFLRGGEARTLLTLTYPVEQDSGDGMTVTGLDPATGETLWSDSGLPYGIAGGLLVLAPPVRPEPPSGGPAHRAGELVAVDVTTGAREWSIPATRGDFRTGGRAPYRAVTLTPEGELTSYDLGTGERLATTQLPPAAVGAQLGNIVGSRVLLRLGLGSGQPGLAAYDVDTLAEQWTSYPSGLPEAGFAHFPCGTAICVLGPGPVQAIDPATGELRWSADWLPAGTSPASTAYHDDGHPLAGYLAVAAGSPSDRSQTQWLIDTETGEPALEIADWWLQLDWGEAAETRLWAFGQPGDGTTTWIGRLRPDLTGIDPIGPVGEASSCQVEPPFVVCVPERLDLGLQRDRVEVWQLRW